MADQPKVISAHRVEKSIQWGEDVFGRELMAISEIKADKLEHQIVFDSWEQSQLYYALGEKLRIRQDPLMDNDEFGPLGDSDDDTEDLDEEVEEDKYLIIETRISGGKKRAVLNWCENLEEAVDTLRTIYTKDELTSLEELDEKVKVVKYSELVGLEDIWEDEEQ